MLGPIVEFALAFCIAIALIWITVLLLVRFTHRIQGGSTLMEALKKFWMDD